MTAYANILVETHGRVGLVRLNRPQALNALNGALIEELNQALGAYEADQAIGAMVLTGSDKAFAAGADIKEMQERQLRRDVPWRLHRPLGQCRTRAQALIAAVAGFALGGGCELAMMCDFILAADTARFGQPEIKLGIIPGGRHAAAGPRRRQGQGDGADAYRPDDGRRRSRASGLVARVVPAAELIDEALTTAATIASYPATAVYAAKESVNRAFETTLAEGLRFERRLFHALFATEDQKEGMRAFAEKRPAAFKNR